MRKGLKKKLILTSSICLLMAFIILLPPAVGYGSGFGDATALSNGTHSDTLLSADDYAYYKIEVKAGSNLVISVAYVNPGGVDLDLTLYDPSQVFYSEDNSLDNPTILDNDIAIGGTYYLEIFRFSGTGDISITIQISGAKGIPGFDIMTTILGLIFSLGIILVLFRNRIRIEI